MVQQLLVRIIDNGVGKLDDIFGPYVSTSVIVKPCDEPLLEKMVYTMLLAYPIGLILYLLPYGNIRHVYNIISGILLVQWGLGPGWLHLFISSSILYYCILYPCYFFSIRNNNNEIRNQSESNKNYYSSIRNISFPLLLVLILSFCYTPSSSSSSPLSTLSFNELLSSPSLFSSYISQLISAGYIELFFVGLLFIVFPLGLSMCILPMQHILNYMLLQTVVKWILDKSTFHWNATTTSTASTAIQLGNVSVNKTIIFSVLLYSSLVKWKKKHSKRHHHRRNYYYIYGLKFLAPFYVILYLSFTHIYISATEKRYPYLVDYFCIPLQMIWVQKMYKLSYNIYDGYVLSNGVDSDGSGKNNKRNNSSRYHYSSNKKEYEIAVKCKQFALENGRIPSIIEYLGYVFCPTTLVMGPSFEFNVYNDAINGRNVMITQSSPPVDKKSNRNKNKGDDNNNIETSDDNQIPSNIWPTLKPLLQAIVMIVMHSYLYKRYNYTKAISEAVTSLPLHEKVLYEYIAGIPIRFEFYTMWKLSEGGTNIWYGGYDGIIDDGKSKKHSNTWVNGEGCDIYKLEQADSLQYISKTWNKTTSNWLKRYIYYRTNGNLVITYFLSALWHGFYPALYMLVPGIVMWTKCERLGRQKLTPYFIGKKEQIQAVKLPDGKEEKVITIKEQKLRGWLLYETLSIIQMHLMFVYIFYPFMFDSYDLTIAFYKGHYFYGHIACILYYIIVSQFPDPPTRTGGANNTTTVTVPAITNTNHNNNKNGKIE